MSPRPRKDQHFLVLDQFVKVISASFFAGINAIMLRSSYRRRREQEREAVDREARLRRDVEYRLSAENARQSSEVRLRSLFENAPIPIREEDLSGMKRLVDSLKLADRDAFDAKIDEHPEFLENAARQIVVVDANLASLHQHGCSDKSETLERIVRTLSPAGKQIVRRTLLAINDGAPRLSYETSITRADGAARTVVTTWPVMPGHEKTYARILLCSVDLTERLATKAALRQAQKMEAVGQLTGGFAP